MHTKSARETYVEQLPYGRGMTIEEFNLTNK